MINNKTFMWTVILNTFSYPCVLIGVFADEWSRVVINMDVEVFVIGFWDDTVIGVVVGTMLNVDIIVVTPVIIVLELFVMSVPYAVVHGLTTVVVDI